MPFLSLILVLVSANILTEPTLSDFALNRSESVQPVLALTRRLPKAISLLLQNQAQARATMARLNRSQVSIRLAAQTLKFTDNFDLLKVNSLTGSGSALSGFYRYQIDTDGENFTRQIATPQRPGLKSYVGIVHSRTTPDGGNVAASILCESKKTTQKIWPARLTPLDSNGVPTCPTGYMEVNY